MCCRSARCRRPATCAAPHDLHRVVADRIKGRAIIASALDNLVKGASARRSRT